MATPTYLQPYIDASRRYGAGFKALLWTSPQTQAARFDALWRLMDFRGRSVLDAGCGHADLLEFLVDRGWRGQYAGVEALPELAAIAERRSRRIVQGDFVEQPQLLDQKMDVIVFCGSLNTLDRFKFHLALRTAAGAARHAVAFNFLSSPDLANAEHLTWHEISEVADFASQIGRDVRWLADYMPGDCTMKFAVK
ncbi:MAG TPA: class I SAM-dependent methyltransferase [Tepidisphaeraceae bacterium]|nr:class I SAM-dependent methyltransferase [Tepidisphaeraceae bacterium]